MRDLVGDAVLQIYEGAFSPKFLAKIPANQKQGDDALLAVDDVECAVCIVENDGAEAILETNPPLRRELGLAVHGCFHVIEQVRHVISRPLVGTLVLRNVKVTAEQFFKRFDRRSFMRFHSRALLAVIFSFRMSALYR